MCRNFSKFILDSPQIHSEFIALYSNEVMENRVAMPPKRTTADLEEAPLRERRELRKNTWVAKGADLRSHTQWDRHGQGYTR